MSGLSLAKFSFDPHDIYGPKYGEIFEKTEKLAVTNAFLSGETFLVLVDVIWKTDPDIREIQKMFNIRQDDSESQADNPLSVVLLQVEELKVEGRRVLYMARGHHLDFYAEMMDTLASEFYSFLEFPLEYTPDKINMQIVGKREDVKGYLDFLSELGITTTIDSIKDYHVKGRALLADLTDRQYECMKLAAEKGYYDIPRKADLRELSGKLGIAHGAFSFHLRKAHRTIAAALFQ